MPERQERQQERREAIAEILRTAPVRSQAELLRRLRQRGFKVTQSSVSRDLHELGAAKVEGRYQTAAMLGGGSASGAGLEELAGFILGMAAAGPHLLVLRTKPGVAGSIGLGLDQAKWPEVVGTLAGDDTIFLATVGRRHRVHLEARISHLMRGGGRDH